MINFSIHIWSEVFHIFRNDIASTVLISNVYTSEPSIGCVLFRWPGAARGRFRDVIDGPGPTGLA